MQTIRRTDGGAETITQGDDVEVGSIEQICFQSANAVRINLVKRGFTAER